MPKPFKSNENSRQVALNAPTEDLLLKAKEQGYFLADDLLAAFPKAEENIAELEEIFIQAADQGLELFPDVNEAERRLRADQRNGDKSETEIALSDLNDSIPDDIFDLYLKEVGPVPLLTAAEEITLAKQMERGLKAEKKLKAVPDDCANGDTWKEQVRMGKKARAQLIRANTRLVISIAKKYRNQGVPFSDLVQEGNLGLIRAVEKFDYRRGCKLSTYATWWIRQAVTRALVSRHTLIHIPVHLGERIRKLHRTADRLEQTLGHKPTPEELALEMNLDPAKVRWILRHNRPVMSLEQPVGAEKDSELGSFIEDRDAPSPPSSAFHKFLQEDLEDVLSTLTPREARVLKLRFGLQNGCSHTLSEIGKKLGLTRERIRQIEQEALYKLRHPRRARRLRDYLK